jgi:hypothetical protein
MTISFRQELQCGHLRSGWLRIAFPRAFALPRRIGADAVHVRGETPRGISVSRKAHTVLITLRPPHGIMCYSIVDGPVTVTFEKAANIGGPTRSGRYRVVVTTMRDRAVVPVRVH